MHKEPYRLQIPLWTGHSLATAFLAVEPDVRESKGEEAGEGRGHLAERILEVARAHDIPIHEDKNLVEILSHLDLAQEIPPEVHKAVAEILAFVYRLTQRHPQQYGLSWPSSLG